MIGFLWIVGNSIQQSLTGILFKLILHCAAIHYAGHTQKCKFLSKILFFAENGYAKKNQMICVKFNSTVLVGITLKFFMILGYDQESQATTFKSYTLAE